VRVFISSTYLDNAARRKIVEDAIIRAGCTPVGMERFTASVPPAVPECQRLASQADVLVGIVAHRYGWIPHGESRSITEIEYDAQRERLMFVIHPDVDVNPTRDFDEGADRWDKQKKLDAFKKRIQVDHKPGYFTDATLGVMVLQALKEWTESRDGAPLAEPVESPVDEVRRYYEVAQQLHGAITLAGFEKRLEVPLDLDELWVNLRAMPNLEAFDRGKVGSAEEAETLAGRGSELAFTEAFRFAEKLKPKRRGLVILGNPGSGKTTVLKRLLLAVIRNGPGALGLAEGTVPVLLPLREFEHAAGGFEAFVDRTLTGRYKTPDNFGDRLRRRRRVLFLLDGCDELPASSPRDTVARLLERCLGEFPDSRFVVSSRYAGYADDARLGGVFLELHIRPMDDLLVAQFVRNWYRAVELSIGPDAAIAAEKAETEAAKFLAILGQDEYRAAKVRELTRNPLLLTAVCLVHRAMGGLPKRRATLLDMATNCILGNWGNAKGIPIRFEAGEARRVLQPVALWMHEKDGRVRARAEELESAIEPALAAVKKSDVGAAQFLETIRDESGLLTGWSDDTFGFLHLNFQEYLAAREILSRSFTEPRVLVDLAKRFGDPWWREVGLLLLALEDPSVFTPYLEAVVEQPGFGRYPDLVDACIEDAVSVSPAPFVALLVRPPGKDRELWARQLAAVRVLRKIAPAAIAELAPTLARHPSRELCEIVAARPELAAVRLVFRGIEAVRIPAGTFLMGSPKSEMGRYDSEGPRHEVTLSEFLLGRYLVTNDEYGRFLKENPGTNEPLEWANRRFNQPRQPVVGVNWDDAQAFCEWAGGRMPTEAEWEYACRAGSNTRFWSGDSEDDLARVAWYYKNSGDTTHAVGEKPANAFGLHDVHGNVWEWCIDWSGAYSSKVQKNPAGPGHGTGRVLRGGGFRSPAVGCRSAVRSWRRPGDRVGGIGFRVAWPARPSS